MQQRTRYEVVRAKWDAHAHHTHRARELGPAALRPDGPEPRTVMPRS